MPYHNEHACRLMDPDKVEVVGSGERKHDGKTYRVVFGKPKGGDGGVEQAYRYPVDEWSESEARMHCEAHEGALFEPATGQASGSGVELRFWAAVHSIDPDGKRLATFYLMNTSPNRNGWAVTDKALEEALPTLLGKPLGCVPGYSVDHVHHPMQVGRWVRVEKPDGYALATAEITDAVAWERVNAGEWGPISVVIKASRVTCSRCGADVTGAPDEHVKNGEGHEVIESFVFDRVDFVAEPAYPQAGILTMGRLAELTTPEGIVLYASQSAKDGAPGPQGNLKPEEERKKRMEAQLEQLKQELEQVKAEKNTMKAENDSLKGRVKALEDERHQERVDTTLEARVKADFVKDRQAEATRLKDLDDRTLDLLREDADKVAEKMAKAPPTGPKAKFTKDDKSAFEAAVEGKREELFGYKRDAQGKVVT